MKVYEGDLWLMAGGGSGSSISSKSSNSRSKTTWSGTCPDGIYRLFSGPIPSSSPLELCYKRGT